MTAATDGARSLAVLVFVHGESYHIGSGNAYDASVLAVVGRLVVITLNYRLGILGIDSNRYSLTQLGSRGSFGTTKDFLFGSKLGFSLILDSFYGAFWRCLRVRLSAEGEPIWMTSGALWVHCWGLALVDFGRDPSRTDSWRSRRNFVV